MGRALKSKPVWIGSLTALATKVLLIDKVKQRRARKRRGPRILKFAAPGLLALGAGGAAVKRWTTRKAEKRARQFSLLGEGGEARPSADSRESASKR